MCTCYIFQVLNSLTWLLSTILYKQIENTSVITKSPMVCTAGECPGSIEKYNLL